MKDKAEMTKEELIALGWIKRPSDKMQEKAEKQLTAVEWLEEELKANLKKVILEGDSELMESLFEQAKEMEKEQIVTTWNTAHQAGRFEGKGIAEENWQTFESYWEENFKLE